MKFSHRSAELETMEVKHKVFTDCYKDAVERQVQEFISEFGKRRQFVSSNYWTEKNSDPWRSWETLHFISLTYKRPIAYHPG